MGLYRRKDKSKESQICWMSFTGNGKPYRKSTETADKKLKEKVYAKVLTLFVEGKWFDFDEGKQHAFEDLTDRYLKEHSAINKTKGSYENDKNYIRHLSKVFAGLTLDKITPRLISEYKTQRYAHHCPESIRYGVDILDNYHAQNHGKHLETSGKFSHFFHDQEVVNT